MTEIPEFDGSDIVQERDAPRLSAHLDRIRQFMSDGKWHTHSEISAAAGVPMSSLPAQLCNLRKPKMGGHLVIKRYLGNGLWEYRLVE